MKNRTHYLGTLSVLLCWMLFTASAVFSQEGRLVREIVHGPSLEKNLTGESPDRNVSIYLPPSYETSPNRRYPVVYLLHGIGDTDKEFTLAWLKGNDTWGTIQGLMNRGIIEGRFGELIIVMPDARTKMMACLYTNSSASGNWEDFVVKDLVTFVDRKYRTLARSESRGIAGHSMDEFTHIPITTRAFSHKLTELGVDHIFEEYNGDHRNRMWGRTGRLYTDVLPYFWLLLNHE